MIVDKSLVHYDEQLCSLTLKIGLAGGVVSRQTERCVHERDEERCHRSVTSVQSVEKSMFKCISYYYFGVRAGNRVNNSVSPLGWCALCLPWNVSVGNYRRAPKRSRGLVRKRSGNINTVLGSPIVKMGLVSVRAIRKSTTKYLFWRQIRMASPLGNQQW